jgi:hypothetical protein
MAWQDDDYDHKAELTADQVVRLRNAFERPSDSRIGRIRSCPKRSRRRARERWPRCSGSAARRCRLGFGGLGLPVPSRPLEAPDRPQSSLGAAGGGFSYSMVSPCRMPPMLNDYIDQRDPRGASLGRTEIAPVLGARPANVRQMPTPRQRRPELQRSPVIVHRTADGDDRGECYPMNAATACHVGRRRDPPFECSSSAARLGRDGYDAIAWCQQEWQEPPPAALA